MSHLDAREFLSDFHTVAKIGATSADGVDRQAATAEDGLTRDWFAAWAHAHGLRVRVDEIGNMFACIEFVPGAPHILVGSHLDSQPLAGRFDGAYGVLAALHAAQELIARVAAGELTPQYNLAVVNWFNEEGSRFAPSIMGSSVYAGLFTGDEMRAVTDLSGVSVAEALSAIGYLGTDTPPEAAGYVEIHIEQGRILERENTPIGLVESSWYTQKLDVEVLGEQSHTGATAMADRKDALVAAAGVVQRVHEVTRAFAEEALVSSVGHFVVEPNSPIVVARRVHLVADLRSAEPEIVQQARAILLEQFHDIETEYGVTIVAKDFDVRPIRRFPEQGVALAERVATKLGFKSRRIQTMAGHDSVALNTMTPALMMFIPSVGGVSHCEREFTTDHDMVLGLQQLTEVVAEVLCGAFTNEP